MAFYFYTTAYIIVFDHANFKFANSAAKPSSTSNKSNVIQPSSFLLFVILSQKSTAIFEVVSKLTIEFDILTSIYVPRTLDALECYRKANLLHLCGSFQSKVLKSKNNLLITSNTLIREENWGRIFIELLYKAIRYETGQLLLERHLRSSYFKVLPWIFNRLLDAIIQNPVSTKNSIPPATQRKLAIFLHSINLAILGFLFTTFFENTDHLRQFVYLNIERKSAGRIDMDSNSSFHTVSSCSFEMSAKKPIFDHSLDDNWGNFRQAGFRMNELRGAKLLRQRSLPHSGNDGYIIDDSFRQEKQKQTYRSTASLLPSLPCSPSKNLSTGKKRVLSSDHCRPQSPRKLRSKQYGSCEENMCRCDSPAAIMLSQMSHVPNNLRTQDHCSNDDKENESPKETDLRISSKMKISDHVLAEQNSPVRGDPGKAQFSFSPKHLYAEGNAVCSPIWPSIHTANETVSCHSSASPLLSSAVYKHGNYFKFPEVDTLTYESTDEKIIYNAKTIRVKSTNNTDKFSSPLVQKSYCDQSCRRVRLKSISLDSDSARLVEDNLGVPVEELVQCKNDEKSLNFQISVDYEQKESCVLPEKNKSKTGITKNEGFALSNSYSPTPCHDKTNGKNKKNLKINIHNGSNMNNSNECNALLKVQTPKTPTLTQSKQKAFSLDSTESNSVCLYSVALSTRKFYKQQSVTNLKAINQLSISVPSTPKRQDSINRKKSCGKPNIAMKPSNIAKTSTNHTDPLNSILKPLDYKQHLCNPGIGSDQSLQIAIDIDDNDGDEVDDASISNFYVEEIEDEVLILNDERSKMNIVDSTEQKKRGKTKLSEIDGHFLGTSLQMQKCGILSLSNSNLETLPEVMTVTDLGDCLCDESVSVQDFQGEQSDQPTEEYRSSSIKTGIGSNILQRRGSNQSLSINLSMNGSLGNLTKCMSASNYSLGSFSGSNYNLSSNHCPQNQPIMCRQFASNNSSTQSIATHGCCNSQLSMMHANTSSPLQQQTSLESELVHPDGQLNRKNILQRRGSNTSLTLNIKGTSSTGLSRFNSHSSLNISSFHTTLNSTSYGKLKQPSQYANNLLQQPQVCTQYHQSQTFRQQQVNRKGLLERRNSNASLTLNINNGLTDSSCNLRASICSLNNITNTSGESFEHAPPNYNSKQEQKSTTEASTSTDHKHKRKFLSSENLNAMVAQCSKLNQTHVRNSRKTCFGSVSDLKPSTGTGNDYQISHVIDSEYYSNVSTNRLFGQSNLCSCTGVRNITTKPLSPQSTSEDFKMYLANIQLLQNATNVLTEEHLRKLHYIFKESYYAQKIRAHVDGSSSANSEVVSNDMLNQQPKSQNPDAQSIHFPFNTLPSDDEKKQLLRSLYEEFWDLPTNHQEKPLVFGSQSKNRYKTILPNEHSRVILKAEYGALHEPYVNANYIKGADYSKNSYIVTQGPLPNTIYDYWLMIQQNLEKYQHNLRQKEMGTEFELHSPICFAGEKHTSKDRLIKKNHYPQKIVMLTNFIENNLQKCAIYFPVQIDQIIFITNSNECFENSSLAAVYETYLNTSSDTDLSHECGLKVKIDKSNLSQLENSLDIMEKNFFLIKNCGLREMDGYSIRQFTVLYVITIIKDHYRETHVRSHANLTQVLKKFTCYHYWFPNWPDHHSPEDVGVLLNMSLHLLDVCYDSDFKILTHQEKSNCKTSNETDSVLRPILNMHHDIEPIPIIHCSAGIGRTGCLAAILNGIRQIRSSIENSLRPSDTQPMDYPTFARPLKNFVNVDILGIVCNLRLQRGGMVQNSEQYELIHRALCLYQSRIDAELSTCERNIRPVNRCHDFEP